jgi:predicted DNA-binding transcriptional regulator YafY
LQYVKSVEVISPKSLRERIKQTLLEGAKQYGD